MDIELGVDVSGEITVEHWLVPKRRLKNPEGCPESMGSAWSGVHDSVPRQLEELALNTFRPFRPYSDSGAIRDT